MHREPRRAGVLFHLSAPSAVERWPSSSVIRAPYNRGRMTNRLTGLMVLLVLGSMISIAIAWLSSYFLLPHYDRAVVVPAEDFTTDATLFGAFPAVKYVGFGVTELDVWLWSGERAPEETAAQFDQIHTENNPRNLASLDLSLRDQLHSISGVASVLRVESGWPLRSLHGCIVGPIQTRQGVGAVVVTRSIEGRSIERALPYRPLWLGLIANTAFYGFTLYLLARMARKLRGLRRVRRGLCPRCRYPIGMAPVCTECGNLLP